MQCNKSQIKARQQNYYYGNEPWNGHNGKVGEIDLIDHKKSQSLSCCYVQ